MVKYTINNQFRPLKTIAYMKLHKTNGKRIIKERIMQEITGGNLQPGDQLLPERELSRIYKTSRTMIRNILDELEKEKRIERKQGNGTFVRSGKDIDSEESPESEKMKFSSERYFSYYPSIKSKLKFYTMDYHPLQKKFWLRLIREFSEIEPSIEILPVFGDEASPDQMVENISAYDVVQLTPFQSGVIPDSKILDIRQLIEKDKLDLGKFLDFAIRPCAKNGFIRGLPFSLCFSGIMAINKDLAAKAGKAIPEKFKDLEHFLNWCSELTLALNGVEPPRRIWGTNLYNYSYYVLSEMGKGFFFKNFIDKSALRKHLGLILQYRGKAYSGTYAIEELYEQFIRSDIAVFPCTTLELLFLKEDVKFPWAIRALPREDSEKYYAVSLMDCIPSDSQYKEEAWEFIKYLSSPRAQLILAEKDGNMPALEEAAFSGAYLSADKSDSQTMQDVLRHGEEIVDVRISDRITVPRRNVNDIWRKLFKENKTNQEILSEIVDLADQINRHNNKNEGVRK